ncbi:hypothetical protein [Massilia sp. S19_KUP03_FR1]|uniref:hypothetical protein n=1 Tax=Massilia sp. S19_KUP03_FR1 TaxID=3025503 RepID=UPI002FCDCE66
MPEVCETVWSLRTDPFYPQIDVDGNCIRAEAVDTDLRPHVDERVLPLYFDVYDWSRSNIGTLSEQPILAGFPTPRTLSSKGLMVLISGPSETGRDSLANLVLHRIAKTTASRKAVVAELELHGYDKSANVAAVANRIISKIEYGEPSIAEADKVAARMRTAFDQFVPKQPLAVRDISYTGLFETFRDILAAIDITLVVMIRDGGDHRSWASIHDSVKSCCSYVIVMTAKGADADVCYNTMLSSRLHVAWIRSKPLDLDRAKEYVRHRVAAERLATAPQGDPLFPFAADAIDALYQPGSTAQPGTRLDHTISALRKTCGLAFAERLRAVPAGAAIADPLALRIDRDDIIRARQKLNLGWKP